MPVPATSLALMIRIPLQNSKRWLTGAAAGLATIAGGERLAGAPWVDVSDSIRRAASLDRFRGSYEGVLGTSLDLMVEAPRQFVAVQCEACVLREIERLRRILSTYDPASEISRVMSGAPVESPELAELFAVYETWNRRTKGLIDVNLGGVIGEWRDATRIGRLPDRARLHAAARRPRAFNVDALGKGFIIDRAVAVARRFAPGGLLNLGGDIRAWGDTAWSVGVADPHNPAENAPPLARFTLREAAVASSGGYARFFEVDGKRFSHLIDPRTQWPLEAAGGATVVAGDCVTANALSTAASIGGAERGASFAQAHGATGYLFTDKAGGSSRGGVLALASEPARPDAGGAGGKSTPVATSANWPAGFQVTVPVVLKKPEGTPQFYRPYVVVWVENSQGQVVRTLTLWGGDERWERKLSTWMRQIRNGETPYTVARATRAAGAYEVVWNGRDDFNRHLPAGNYTIRLEICREAGDHVVTAASVVCGDDPANAALAETAESGASTITYGPVTKRG